MNVFEAVKQSVTTREAAEMYGIQVNRNGIAVCPFHNDKNPSLKVDTRFHCFGCQADGDVIDFTAALFDISLKEAAVKLAEDFTVTYDERERTSPSSATHPARSSVLDALRFKQAENRCYRVYSNYLRLLRQWQEEYAPQTPEEEWHPLFMEAMQKKDYVEYLLNDVLLNGTTTDKAKFILEHGKDVANLERRIYEFTAGYERGSSSYCR